MAIRWIVAFFVGYWLVGMIGIIAFDQGVRRTLARAVGMMVLTTLWLPLWVMEIVERASARIKVDLVDEEDHTK